MVIAILMVIIGAVALVGLPVAQYPNIVPPQIQVRTNYTGADAVTVEQSVATPIEQQMSSVEKMLYVQSTNANDGTLLLQVTFDVDSNIDIDQVNTQNKVAQAQLRPHGVSSSPTRYGPRAGSSRPRSSATSWCGSTRTARRCGWATSPASSSAR